MGGRGGPGPGVIGALVAAGSAAEDRYSLLFALLKFIGFILLGYLLYSPAVQVNRKLPGQDSFDSDGWDWDFVDCMYFSITTLTTVGYGDMPTLRQESRLVTMIFALFGAFFVGSSIGVVADWFTKRAHSAFIARQRVLLLEAQNVVNVISQGSETSISAQDVENRESSKRVRSFNRQSTRLLGAARGASGPNGEKGGEGSKGEEGHESSILAKEALPDMENIECGSSQAEDAELPELPTELSSTAKHTKVEVSSQPPSRQKTAQVVPVDAPLDQGLEAQRSSTLHQSLWGCCRSSRMSRACTTLFYLQSTICFLVLCIILGEIENHYIDGCGFGWGWRCFMHECDELKQEENMSGCWSWLDELYYSVMTYTTIGYGDISPRSKAGKILASFLMPLAVLSFTILFGYMHNVRQAKQMGVEKTLSQRLTELAEVIEQDDNGSVTQEEYIIFNLRKMGKVDDDTLSLLKAQFTALDADGSGELDAEDIRVLRIASSGIEQSRGQIRTGRTLSMPLHTTSTNGCSPMDLTVGSSRSSSKEGTR